LKVLILKSNLKFPEAVLKMRTLTVSLEPHQKLSWTDQVYRWI